MSIPFKCSQCGKDYLVSDALAGKRAVCKACNNRMTIPGGAAPAPSPAPMAQARPVSAPSARPAAARSAPARPATANASTIPTAKVISRGPEPAHDIYGLDEAPAPLPPMMPRTPGADPTVAEAPAKKKKKKGFFSGGKKKASSGGGFQFSGGVGVIRLIVIVVAAVGGAVGGWGLLPKSAVESFHTTLIAQRAELSGVLHSIQSADSARAAAPRVQEILTRMTKHLEDNGFKKGRKEDIQEINARYAMKHQADAQRLVGEFSRIAMIPGALDALGIQAQIQRLDAVEKRLQREAN